MMKEFAHFSPSNVEEAVDILKYYEGEAVINAGGTDLLGLLKDRVLPRYPEAVVDIKRIPGLEGIHDEEEYVYIGALTRVADIARNPLLQRHYSALAQAARKVGSPQIREMGTIGGNICQDVRCWYYRCPDNRFPCLRKGGVHCFAWDGDSRYHSIFGGYTPKGCIAVHPSDIAPALVILDAQIVTSKRLIRVEEFFDVGICKTNILGAEEIVLGVRLPRPIGVTTFQKFALRKSIDFGIVNCAVLIDQEFEKIKTARICLNAVSPIPRRVSEAETLLTGATPSQQVAREAGQASVREAVPLKDNRYMTQIAQTLIQRAVSDCIGVP
jgi:xanthine dehydrogenase YagS FAD-binding subunit